MRDQLQADSHLLAREQREKQALERQLEDANFECRKIAVLQHRVDFWSRPAPLLIIKIFARTGAWCSKERRHSHWLVATKS